MKSNLRIWILVFALSLVLSAFAVDEEIKTLYGLEGKIGFAGERDDTPYGIAGNFRTKLLLDKLKAGGDFGVMVTSNWEDSLDLHDSPEPSDTALYDTWVRSGTDVSFILGPRVGYKFLGSDLFSARLDFGFGVLFCFTSYDDVKKSNSGSQSSNVSEIESDIEFYARPRLEIQYNRVYAAYEYYIADNIGQTICIGIMFF
ncbi:MAG: hypothetical protein ACP5G4_00915 [bacterium]